MTLQSDNQGRQVILQQLSQYVKGRISKKNAALLEQFARRYYVSASLEDLRKHSIEDLFGALLSHWNFIYQRSPGESKIRIFNPTLEKEGYTSKYTIIEISHDDIPFLVDSTRMEIDRSGIRVNFIVNIGGLKVIRDSKYRITGIVPMGQEDPKAVSEAPIYFEIDRIEDPVAMEKLRIRIMHVLQDVQDAVSDWPKMMQAAQDVLQELEQTPPPFDPAEIAESKDFLRWLMNNHFTFLGCRDYKLIGKDASRALKVVPKSGLGVLRDENHCALLRSYSELPPEARKLALSKNILIIAKTNTKSTIHRSTYTDYIGVKRFNAKGELIGERRFIGLYTSTVYHSSPRHIPFLRHKVEKVIDELHFPTDSHNGKEVVHILETLPRDDLFQATHEELTDLTLGILQLQERKQIRLFVRQDAYHRYFSCLVYVPRDIFTTELGLAMQDVLIQSFHGLEASFNTYFSDSVLARLHYLIRVNPKKTIHYSVSKIEEQLVAVSRTWADELKMQLMNAWGEEMGLAYYDKYAKVFPASYIDYYLPSTAIEDIKKIERLSLEHPLEMTFYRLGTSTLRLKLYHRDALIPLSDVLPTLENLGLRVMDERPHEIIFKEGNIVWISDFDMVFEKNYAIDIDRIQPIFQEAFWHIWFRHAEDDGLNRLVIGAQLDWREVSMLRAYTKYLRQIGFTFSQPYIEEALSNNREIVKNLVLLFKLRFLPDYQNEKRLEANELIETITQSFDSVISLDEDRILRRLLELILATLRTNFYQTTPQGEYKASIALKFDPAAISDLPLPRPLFEIFIYSPRVEGVHLRGGKVARGGIRWSDRREDFRTEVLGLMKAQQVKNAVIVPLGAKGGFFPKQLPVDGDRDLILKEVVEAYSIYIRGLLDITDNIKHNAIVPPKEVVRYDQDDPYLVVAADKGTATFSDIANRISADYHFWLGDAFASGGSAGYDHKKMGITSRGAWESVKRHFRELSTNVETTDITVIGIGDMSGDVFGNGMLRSKHIKLIGAFDHRHIFLDPDPDPMLSYNERLRLFQLPRSSWLDYDPAMISKGGGVFNRSAKVIPLSPEIQKLLGIRKESLMPSELIRHMLKAPVDLLWNGGIGTFIKSSTESHADVGDRTNDAIRIDGHEVAARVIAEGGNLGLTQLARIEYSLNNGICFTDFIDNSAGVDCSDHEVNIKILLNKLVADRKMTLAQRNSLLEKMTDEVASLVLRDNYEQTQMLSLETSVSLQTLNLYRRYIGELEKKGRLNRQLEFLPDEKALTERKNNGQGLTRPEIAVLMAYCNLELKQAILDSNIPEDPYFVHYLAMGFPHILCKKYLNAMKHHRLRREIIATQLGKYITNHMGINFVERLQRETSTSIAEVIRAFVVSENIYGMNQLWMQIEALDDVVGTGVQYKMMLQIYYLIRRATRWFLRTHRPNMSVEETIAQFAKPVAQLTRELPHVLTAWDREKCQAETQSLVDQGVPLSLAKNIASCSTLFTSLDIVEAASKHNLPLLEVAKVYYALGSYLELNELRENTDAYPMDNQWDELARSHFRDDLDRIQRKLSVHILKSKKGQSKSFDKNLSTWMDKYHAEIERWQQLVADLRSNPNVTFVAYSVALRELSHFIKVA